MSISKKIRIQAKETLAGNWTSSLSALFVLMTFFFVDYAIYALATYLCLALGMNTLLSTVISLLAGIITMFFTSPAFNGYLKFNYLLSQKKDADISNLFFFFKNSRYFRTLGFNLRNLCRSVLCILWFLVLLLDIINLQFEVDISQIILTVFTAIVLVITTLTDFAKNSIAHIIYIDNPDMEYHLYFSIAKIINKNHYADNHRLAMSFIPCVALCYFVVPVLYVFPYFTLSFATSAKWLTNLYKDGKIV